LGGDALIGGRHDKIDLGGDREWWDMFVGPRSTWQATEELALFARGDVGGFGIGSSSQLTWQIKAGGEYAISKYAFLELGYRLLDIDYEEGSGSDKFRFDVQMGGPYMGLGVKF
jgi:opacity protein-like surface antigen